MSIYFKQKRMHFFYRLSSVVIIFSFIFSSIVSPSLVYSQITPQYILNLPNPGIMISSTEEFTPTIIRGLTIHPDNSLGFNFIVDKGDANLEGNIFKEESQKLIKYFLAGLTIPKEEMWVNLSPYEKDKIIPKGFGDTKMGRDMLAQDYMLKQLTASLMYPEKELGKKFWERVYKRAFEKYGTTEVPMNTFNKVWIVPEKAEVFEKGSSVFVVDSRLKVMLEEDYLAMENNSIQKNNFVGTGLDPVHNENTMNTGGVKPLPYDKSNSFQTQIVRDIIIPAIEKEVNEGKTFANLRQIYNSIILATWYKNNLKESLLGQVYVNQQKTQGVDTEDKTINQKIYQQYVKAFETGVYNYIKEDVDLVTNEVIPRKYFSGGVTNAQLKVTTSSSPVTEKMMKVILAKHEMVTIDTVFLENAAEETIASSSVDDTPFYRLSDPEDKEIFFKELVISIVQELNEEFKRLASMELSEELTVEGKFKYRSFEVGYRIEERAKKGDRVVLFVNEEDMEEYFSNYPVLQYLKDNVSNGLKRKVYLAVEYGYAEYSEPNIPYNQKTFLHILEEEYWKVWDEAEKEEFEFSDQSSSVEVRFQSNDAKMHIVKGKLTSLNRYFNQNESKLPYIKVSVPRKAFGVSIPSRIEKIDLHEIISVSFASSSIKSLENNVSSSSIVLGEKMSRYISESLNEATAQEGSFEGYNWEAIYKTTLLQKGRGLEAQLITKKFTGKLDQFSSKNLREFIIFYKDIDERGEEVFVIRQGMRRFKFDSNGQMKPFTIKNLLHHSRVLFQKSSKVVTKGDVAKALNMFVFNKDNTDLTASSSVGGIDFNTDLIDWQIERDGKGIPLPIDLQSIDAMKINGFIPIIINVTPVNLPFLLGFQMESFIGEG